MPLTWVCLRPISPSVHIPTPSLTQNSLRQSITRYQCTRIAFWQFFVPWKIKAATLLPLLKKTLTSRSFEASLCTFEAMAYPVRTSALLNVDHGWADDRSEKASGSYTSTCLEQGVLCFFFHLQIFKGVSSRYTTIPLLIYTFWQQSSTPKEYRPIIWGTRVLFRGPQLHQQGQVYILLTKTHRKKSTNTKQQIVLIVTVSCKAKRDA